MLPRALLKRFLLEKSFSNEIRPKRGTAVSAQKVISVC